MRKNWVVVAALAGLLAGIQWTKAATAFTIDDTTGSSVLANPPFTLGFQFTVNSNITVSALGIFDDAQDGLADRYETGIWDNSGTLVASAIIDDGTTDPLVNQFRYKSIAPVLLTPGTYNIGALFATSDDSLLFPGSASNFATASQITFVQSTFAAGGSLTDPTGTAGADAGYFGPNFIFSADEVTTHGVPLPSSAAAGMALLGVLGLGTVIRRRSAVQA